MLVRNLLTTTCPFNEYLDLPGYSYSGIKNEGKDAFKPTAKMQLGTSVHNYLLTPEEYDHSNKDLVRPLAVALKQRLGVLIEILKPELAVTADFCHEGLVMPYKGRIDLCAPGKIVIDIKVSEMPLLKAIDFFGYDRQTSGYAMAIGARAALIIAINPKTKLTTLYNVPINSYFWEQQILIKGEPEL